RGARRSRVQRRVSPCAWQCQFILIEGSVDYEGWGDTEVSDGMSALAARKADMPESCGPAHRGLLLVAFAFVALLAAELVLITTIPGTNYDGADGKAAQAEILATLAFARPFEITNLNPLQGLWAQMMPMNVWVNPAYWPFAFFDKELAAEISGVAALICYAVGCDLIGPRFR